MISHHYYRFFFEMLLLQAALTLISLQFLKTSATISHFSKIKKFFLPASENDPEAREIIFYLHGWQRNPFHFESHEQSELVKKIEKKGYIFKELLWHKHAHSEEVREVQHRIWSEPENFVDKMIEQIDKTILQHRLPFRIVGHSLGNQLALKLSDKLTEKYPFHRFLWPQRVGLLEPAFVKKFPADQSTEENSLDKAIKILKKLEKKGIAIEIYRSSFITRTSFIGHSNQALISNLPYPSVDINYPLWDWFRFAFTHDGAKIFYFKSLLEEPKTVSGTSMQYAASSIAQTFHHYHKHFEQIIYGKNAGLFFESSKNNLPSKCPLMSFLKIGAQVSPSQETHHNTGYEPVLFTQHNISNAGKSFFKKTVKQPSPLK